MRSRPAQPVSWLAEVEGLGASVQELHPAARAAVAGVIDAFATEDGRLPQPVSETRRRLRAANAGLVVLSGRRTPATEERPLRRAARRLVVGLARSA